MPVEIGQLVFRARVELEQKDQGPSEKREQADVRQLVELCVEQVLEILRREKER